MHANLFLKHKLFRIAIAFAIILTLIPSLNRLASAQAPAGYFREVRTIYTAEYGIARPSGVIYAPDLNALLVMQDTPSQDNSSLIASGIAINLFEDLVGDFNFQVDINTPANFSYNPRQDSFFLLDSNANRLVEITQQGDGLPQRSNQNSVDFSIEALQVNNPQGISFDPATGNLFILDARKLEVLKVSPDASGSYNGENDATQVRVERISLDALNNPQLQGIAYNPNNQNLYIASASQHTIYELSQEGQLISYLDLSSLPLNSLQTIFFADSADQTDDPAIQNLYLADRGNGSAQGNSSGKIIELSLIEPQLIDALLASQTATLIQTIDTSLWNPNSPDPVGIDYNPFTDTLWISDSEVEEMPPYFQGVNMFQSTRGGILLSTFSTTSFSLEPAGISIDEINQKMYISDDSQDRIYEIDRGPDGLFGTGDDMRTFIDTREYNIFDPEDVAVGGGYMYIADGINGEIYVISPGPNGIFDGYTSGDDILAYQFDTAVMGLSDVEGIDYNSDSGTLYMVGPFSRRKLVEATITGTFLQVVDIEFLNAIGPSDVSYAPSSYNTSIKSLYISQRGVDNDTDPLENDGKIFEILLSGPGPGPTETPTQTATFTPTNTPTAHRYRDSDQHAHATRQRLIPLLRQLPTRPQPQQPTPLQPRQQRPIPLLRQLPTRPQPRQPTPSQSCCLTHSISLWLLRTPRLSRAIQVQ